MCASYTHVEKSVDLLIDQFSFFSIRALGTRPQAHAIAHAVVLHHALGYSGRFLGEPSIII